MRAVVKAMFYGVDGGINGRQRPLVVETLGRLRAVIVMAASVSAPAGARLRCARLGGACQKLRLLWVDGAYRGQLVAWVRQPMRVGLRVPGRPEGAKGFGLLPRRWGANAPWHGATNRAV
jgi:putative transposase